VLAACDGEQILGVDVRAGLARRDFDEHLRATSWREMVGYAAGFDPDAPSIGAVAVARALDALTGREPSAAVIARREALVALDRARSALRWSARLFEVIGAERWCMRVRGLLSHERPSSDAVRRLARSVQADRALRLRTRVALPSLHTLRSAGVTGPLVAAAEAGGDVSALLSLRLTAASSDLESALGLTRGDGLAADSQGDGRSPSGTARVVVPGPRGSVALTLAGDGGPTPTGLSWARPSRPLLSLIPIALAGQKLGDAETILAALDPSPAEADG
jgi:NADH:ubiquinone oxidoreductase subunit D